MTAGHAFEDDARCRGQGLFACGVAVEPGLRRTEYVPMNIALSVCEPLVRRGRKKADALGKSLNQLVREYLERLAGSDDAARDVAKLGRLSRKPAGSARGWRFNRAELHERS